jgi:ATP-dependent exoDNAse (exonuclease V) alpha subunit
LNGITIHKFLGLKDGRFSADELSEKNIMTIDCIIIDEISMLSWKLFQEIEHVCVESSEKIKNHSEESR